MVSFVSKLLTNYKVLLQLKYSCYDQRDDIHSLILVPTRELTIQIEGSFEAYIFLSQCSYRCDIWWYNT